MTASAPAWTDRPVTASDLPAIARIHLLAFPDSALTMLGAEPVRRYYEWQLAGPHDAVALCVDGADGLAGFCFGGVFRGALSGFLRRNRSYLALRLASRPWLLGSRFVRQRTAAGIRSLIRHRPSARPSPAPTAASEERPRERAFGILAIAVSPTVEGGGVGGFLMGRMEEHARDRGFRRMQLTVSPTNVRAVRFYERLGWERDPGAGEWKGSMTKAL